MVDSQATIKKLYNGEGPRFLKGRIESGYWDQFIFLTLTHAAHLKILLLQKLRSAQGDPLFFRFSQYPLWTSIMKGFQKPNKTIHCFPDTVSLCYRAVLYESMEPFPYLVTGMMSEVFQILLKVFKRDRREDLARCLKNWYCIWSCYKSCVMEMPSALEFSDRKRFISGICLFRLESKCMSLFLMFW